MVAVRGATQKPDQKAHSASTTRDILVGMNVSRIRWALRPTACGLLSLSLLLTACDDDSSGGDTDSGTDSDSVGEESGSSPSSAGTNAGSGGMVTTADPTGGTSGPSGSSDGPNPTTGDETGDETSGGPVEPPPGLSCDTPFTHAGYDGCQTTVDELEIKYFPLDEDVPAERLVVFLHGDTGADYIENWGFAQEILDWAMPQNYLVIGIRSPASYDGDTSPSFGAAQPVHADMVATTIESVREAYAVVEERNLYWGVSGGSWFTTSSFIPVAGTRVPGIFVANCGGSGVSFGWEWDPASDPESVALNSLYFNYGDQDFLADNSAASYAEYTELGFVTDQLVHEGATHCAHPIPGPTLDFWIDELEG